MFDLSGPNVAFQPADQLQGASMNAHERDTKPDSLKKEMRLNYFQPWCQRMLKIKCSPDVSDPPVYKK